MNDKIVTFFKTKAEIEKDCEKWAAEIEQTYKPDIIIFVAKSGFLFARPLAKYFDCEMVDVVASRTDNDKIDFVKKLVPFMPKHLLAFLLRKKVSNPTYHVHSDRIIAGTPRFEKTDLSVYNSILLLDDSVDTGWSLLKVKDFIEANGAGRRYKTASYCVLTESKNRVSVDFCRYIDSIVITATSRYSKEYRTFIKDYDEWKIVMNKAIGE